VRKAGHAAVGSAAGFVASFVGVLRISTETTLFGFAFTGLIAWLFGMGLGAFGAEIPDLLDNPKKLGPNHRRLAHSVVVLAGVSYCIYAILTDRWVMEGRIDVLFLLPFLAGYASHLIVDAPSKKHLPFLF